MSLVSYGLSRNVLARGNDTLPGSVCITVFTLLLIISPVVFFVLLDFFSRSLTKRPTSQRSTLETTTCNILYVRERLRLLVFFFLFLFLYET